MNILNTFRRSNKTGATSPMPQAEWHISTVEVLYRSSGFFAWRLKKDAEGFRLLTLPDLWRGRSKKGADILNQNTPINYHDVSFSKCDWIKDVQTYGGSQARSFIRNSLSAWMTRHSRWSRTHWQPDILGARLLNLIFSFDWFASSASTDFQKTLIHMMVMHRNCLARDWNRIADPLGKLTALTAYIVSCIVLVDQQEEEHPSPPILPDRLLAQLIEIAESQIYEDGGHISRQPETHYEMLQRLIECRTAFGIAKISAPPELENIIQKMGRMIKFWRKPEAGLPHFNFAGELPASDIDLMLNLSTAKGGLPNHTAQSGFCRLSSARTLLMIDTGASLPNSYPNPAGRLSFEMMVGAVPVIVNSGQTAQNPKLNQALCQTAAHSTLGLDHYSSDKLGIIGKTVTTECRVGEAEQGQLCEATHDGFLQSHGILHTRRLFLAQSGKDIRGSDHLVYTGKPGEIPQFAFIRFHLHPRISAAMTGNQQILLKLPRARNRWLFKSSAGEVALETSIYMEAGIRQNCQQIVLKLPVHDIQSICEKTVNWAIRIYKS